MALKNHATKFISVGLTALLLIFAYKYISGLISGVNLGGIKINWWILVASGGVFTLFYLILSFHWVLACKMVDADAREDQGLSFFASQPYKYLPTSLFTFSFRAVYAKKLGLNVAKSSASQLIENTSMLLSNVILFSLLYLGTLAVTYSLLFGAIVGMVLLLFLRLDRLTLMIRGRRLVIDSIRIMKLLLLSMIAWIISGISFALLNIALGMDLNIIGFMAANTLAFSLSILAFFAPGGIGIRELVYDFFSVSGASIIIWRVLTFILDFTLGLIAIFIIKARTDKQPN